MQLNLIAVVVTLTALLAPLDGALAADFHAWAPTPPRGWNSWDIFGCTLTEAQAKAQADAQAKYLLPSGYKYFTVDIQWYEPNAQGHVYKPGAPLTMDGYGRLLPAPNRFPSAADGKGFKPLADYVHAKGLKFGIHYMRGIPRQAVRENTPIFGTALHAQDIALTNNTCCWNPDMFGVDLRKPGAQAYYDALVAQWAAWGVDFVKVDDISRPYDEIQLREIAALRKAIDKTGRAIVLSLSPGDTPLRAGEHVSAHANMWRISDDFWARWQPLHGMFRRLHDWEPYRKAGAWPDADMLPFGIISFDQKCGFTEDEQTTCMTLWSIARSPLIFGGDMTRLDDFTTQLLTNPEVLAVNQASENNRQLSRTGDHIVWTADVPGTKEKYVALFNADTPGFSDRNDGKAAYRSIRVGRDGMNEVEIKAVIRGSRKLVLAVTDAGDGFEFDHAAWIRPTLKGPKGELDLRTLEWASAKVGWGEARVGKTTDGAVVDGIGVHAKSEIVWNLPEGYDTFTAKGTLVDGMQKKNGSVEFLVLTDAAFAHERIPEESEISVDLKALGFNGYTIVRDLWARRDLGEFKDEVKFTVKAHACRLFKIIPLDVKTNPGVAAGHETMAEGPFAPTWASLNANKVPDWFRDAKFGIWAHWGPQCVEGSGDWMARKMYVEGTPQWKYHREHYGHQSEFGFKDILPLFRAEKWEPETLVRYYKSLGAEYFFALANHHDNFDLWDSRYQPWNVTNMGPKRDVLGAWAAAARQNGLKFGVSFHADHAWTWYEPSRHYDRTGPKAGVPYDGVLTKADGKGKWWEGYDPQDLYRQNHPESKDSWVDNYGWNGWSWNKNLKAMPSAEFIQNYLDRTMDCVNRYHPDLVYLDTVVLPFTGVTERGLELVAHLYNTSAANHKGRQESVIFAKMLGNGHRPALTLDVERGTPGKILDEPWQTCTCLGDWHYNTDFYNRDRYKPASLLVKMLADVVSKNGNLLLSVPLRADGTFDEKEKAILDEFGAWMKVNGEAIKGTRPWRVFGEGPLADAASGKEGADFNEDKLRKAGAEEVRYTQKNGAVYAILMGNPSLAVEEASSPPHVTLKSFTSDRITAVELLGHGALAFSQAGGLVKVTLPEELPTTLGPVLKLH